jgi:hypothetical protein
VKCLFHVWKTKKLLYICPTQKGTPFQLRNYEKNIPTLEKKKKKQARFSRTHGISQRAKSFSR